MRKFFPLLLLVLLACVEEETSEVAERDSFTRIYDNNIFSYTFSPVDVLETSDGGYVVLATRFTPEVPMGGVHLLKADAGGNFVRDIPLADEMVNPLPGMALRDGRIHFVCMSDDSQAKLVSMDENLDALQIADVALNYPAAASFNENEFLILSYDQIEKKTVFARVSLNGNVSAGRFFTITYDDSMEDEILKHFLRTGTRYPFQVGRIPSGPYFFNGFHNYTFSLVFTNLGDDDDADGVVQGQQDHGGFSAIEPIGGGRFATAFFNYNDQYFQPFASLSPTTLTSVADVSGYDMREIVPHAPVQIMTATAGDRNVAAYASSTQSKQIGIFLYDQVTGEFLGSKYVGFTNPFEFGRMTNTSDGGLIIAGNTYIAGRFSRICLIKLSKDEFSSIIR